MLILIFLCCTLVYILLGLNYNYWKKRGVIGPKPSFFFGNIAENLLVRKHLGEIVTEIYREYPNEPYVGIYKVFNPVLLVRDLDLARDVMTNNFNHFDSNDFFIDYKNDILYGRNPFVLPGGDAWKTNRTELISCFTGSKLRTVYPLLNESAVEWLDFIRNHRSKNKIVIEVKDLCEKFTLNNVANCAFGLEGAVFKGNSEFEKLGKGFMSPGGWTSLVMFLSNLFPKLTRLLANQVPVKLTPAKVEDALIDIVSKNIRSRTQNNIVRKDFLSHLITMNGKNSYDEDMLIKVTAHATSFLMDGYETSGITMSYFLYHIATNDEVQTKLRDEINECIKNESDFTYETVKGMEYLDACFNESMRLNPIALHVSKLCTQDFRYKDFLIEKGSRIIIPISGFHSDPKYFDQPERFMPERFLSCNREQIIKGTYMPFGDGPRMCPGLRFGLLQVKTGLVHLLKKFKLSLNEKTKTPLQYDPVYFLVSSSGEIWINFEEIQSTPN